MVSLTLINKITPMKTKLLLPLLCLTFVNFTLGAANTATQQPKVVTKDVVSQAVTTYDDNHNGKLDKGELQLMQKLEPKLFDQGILFDKDKSGSLTIEELQKWRDFVKNTGKK